jgi:hypothetical protein
MQPDSSIRRVLPAMHYPLATLRCYLPTCSVTGEIGLGFNQPDGAALRMRISNRDAWALMTGLMEDLLLQGYRPPVNQSPISDGNPSLDGSVVPGQLLCPPAKSSSAC